MKLFYIKDSSLDKLKSNINANIEFYQKDSPWLEEYFGQEVWALQSKITSHNINLKEPIGRGKLYDVENAIEIHQTMDLSITQASDERLWTYLTHVTFWHYMQVRWKAEKDTVIKRRYFFDGGDTRFTRNGIARLWWAAEITKDENRKDPYELTKILFSTQDVAQNLLERSFSRNTKLAKYILSAMSKYDPKVYTNVELNRSLMKYFNSLGGISVLDLLTEKDVQEVVDNKISKLSVVV